MTCRAAVMIRIEYSHSPGIPTRKYGPNPRIPYSPADPQRVLCREAASRQVGPRSTMVYEVAATVPELNQGNPVGSGDCSRRPSSDHSSSTSSSSDSDRFPRPWTPVLSNVSSV